MKETRWLDYRDQIKEFKDAGLEVSDEDECLRFLQENSYYRFLGYFRHFQSLPMDGEPFFNEGTTFEEIREIYDLDRQLSEEVLSVLFRIELVLRGRFSHFFGEKYSQSPNSFLQSGIFNGDLCKAIRGDLKRAVKREPFLKHYVKSDDNGGPTSFRQLPVWGAVEVFSFGTLLRCVEACDSNGVAEKVANSLGLAKSDLKDQMEGFQYLRNRCAHQGRLWNHCVNEKESEWQEEREDYTTNSVYKRLVDISAFLYKAEVCQDWLSSDEMTKLFDNERYKTGLTHPVLYPGQ
ncbi:MAG: Abi family protein [Actinomycetaceae bacterium]|nr:Abi family protein [Actinomycetaceae bacterium]